MITTEIAEKLKRGIGPNYCQSVQDKLAGKNLRTRTGSTYKKGYIVMVMNGDREIPAVEEAIFEAYTESVKQIIEDARELGVPIPEPGEPIS